MFACNLVAKLKLAGARHSVSLIMWQFLPSPPGSFNASVRYLRSAFPGPNIAIRIPTSRSRARIPITIVMIWHRLPQWIRQHWRCPKGVNRPFFKSYSPPSDISRTSVLEVFSMFQNLSFVSNCTFEWILFPQQFKQRFTAGGRGRLHCFTNRFLVWCCMTVWRHIATAQPRANSFQIDRKERSKEEIISRILRKWLRFLCKQLFT